MAAKVLVMSRFLVLMGLLSLSSAPAAADDYDWTNDVTATAWDTDEAAVDSATVIARKCLEAFYNWQDPHSCVKKPFDACFSQYDGGKQNQYDANRCAGFSASAWGRIVDDVYDRLLKSGEAPKEIARSQAMWKAWSDVDCHVIADYIGSRSAMDSGICRSRHAAERVFELSGLLPN
jgi:hypothetical protein